MMQTMQHHLCKHLLGIVGSRIHTFPYGEPYGQQEIFCFSGFALSIDDRWYLVTAGHVMESLEEALNEGCIIGEQISHFHDTEENTTFSFEFDYVSTPRKHEYDPNLLTDFGILEVPSDIQVQLKNCGVEAIDERIWHSGGNKYDMHGLFGMPDEFTNIQTLPTHFTVEPDPTLIPVTKVRRPRREPRRSPLVYARMASRSRRYIRSIVGVSGGPIFAWKFRPHLEYWVTAIQSGLFRRRRIIFGYPFHRALRQIRSWIDRDELNP